MLGDGWWFIDDGRSMAIMDDGWRMMDGGYRMMDDGLRMSDDG